MPIVAPFNPSADILPSAAGTVDIGSVTVPYKSEYLTDLIHVSSVPTIDVDADVGITAANFTGTNSGGAFSGGVIIGAFGGEIPSIFPVAGSAVGMDPGDPILDTFDLFLIQTYGGDGTNFIFSAATFNVIADANSVPGTIFAKIGMRNGPAPIGQAELFLRSSGIQEYKNHTGYSEAYNRQTTGVVDTVDATPTVIQTHTLNDDTTYNFKVKVQARFNSATPKGVWGFLEFGVYRNNAGAAVLSGTRLKSIDGHGASGYDFDVAVSGNDVEISVTGAGGETVSWTSHAEWQSVSTAS